MFGLFLYYSCIFLKKIFFSSFFPAIKMPPLVKHSVCESCVWVLAHHSERRMWQFLQIFIVIKEKTQRYGEIGCVEGWCDRGGCQGEMETDDLLL